MINHHYSAPGPVGCSCNPGPRYRPDLQQAITLRTQRLAQSQSQSRQSTPVSTCALATQQRKVQDLHADMILQHHTRMVAGSVFGHSTEAGMSTAQRVAARGGPLLRKPSLPLLAAGFTTSMHRTSGA
mmetsp:Transcript_46785/g.100171  ORF Transcript_46785/g.100171 Transcript_46785/m.100171 type:complete len:128 (-) Transcript_46785:128-511(-)|eukprot:CAMPEP_0206488700 /NCGR_PEP_ID=MMETSP0324_2-20121206/42614_1 /ASSEMBLY_ACC=CAM_ASM_000836 /TAXON_ID=2866 /ORGANISM="Crypthecodinium cohnii, Strain Seligo" /LENGTH=127 /DNA_ID=CAMNT_0053967865 /DNA_START=42 /DNA_END=425 /DNA_ORIENTATION=-